MPLIEVNGVRLLVEESGAGEPVVLVHGSWNDREIWGLVEPELASAYRVISYDRRGHTGSEDSPEPGSRRDDEDDLAALVETIVGGPAHVVGNSFGGTIALSFAARRPDLVRSVFVHEPPLFGLVPDDPDVVAFIAGVGPVLELIDASESEQAARLFVDQVLGPGVWDELPPPVRASVVGIAATFAGEVRDPNWTAIDLAALRDLERPVLFTHGAASPPFFSAVIQKLNEMTPRAEVVTIAGAGHVPHTTHPELWLATARGFLDSAR